ncbi:MAG: hypothetical protein C5B51_04470 [Terriglobia bacterium]|nr:MAG: hypothetical protein C5B51_04470 [Terriglobia bacterium]
MHSLRAIAVILVLAAAAWSAGVPSAAQRPTPPKPANRAASADAQIESTIRAKFAKSKINAEKFQVHVQGGVATIEGKTDVVQHKGVATRLAKTGGAVAVANHIQISDAAREKAAANLETGRRRAQIKRGEPRSDAPVARQAH